MQINFKKERFMEKVDKYQKGTFIKYSVIYNFCCLHEKAIKMKKERKWNLFHAQIRLYMELLLKILLFRYV